MGYSRAGGLRPSEAAIVSGHRRDPDVFLGGFARFPGEYTGEMDARGETLLSERAHHPRREQERSEKRSEHDQGAQQDETGARQTARRPINGRKDQRFRLPRVFG